MPESWCKLCTCHGCTTQEIAKAIGKLGGAPQSVKSQRFMAGEPGARVSVRPVKNVLEENHLRLRNSENLLEGALADCFEGSAPNPRRSGPRSVAPGQPGATKGEGVS
jgi:hypothetical protein